DKIGAELVELRAAKRTYKDSPVSFEEFSHFLQLLGTVNVAGSQRYLYRSLKRHYGIKPYIVVEKNGVENVPYGVFLYDPLTHSISLVSKDLAVPIKTCYTPFNRKHANDAKFRVFLVAEVDENAVKDRQLYLSVLEAGYIGQLLLDRQAEFNIGVCPI